LIFVSDFIPDDTGVGVPLPPEDDDVVSNSIDFDEKPVKTLEEKPVDDDDDETFQEKPVEIVSKKEPAKTFEEKQIKKSFQNLFPFPRDRNFDEDDFIRQMENFHFIRYSDIVARSPNFNPFIAEPETGTPTTTIRPRVPIRTTPSSFSYSHQNQPVASPLVAEKPRQPFSRQTIPTTTTTSTTTSTTTTERTTTTTQKSRSTTTTTTPAPTSVKSLNRSVFKELTPPRVPKSFPRFPPQNFQHAALTAQLDFAPKIQVNITL
jgi:hypothetical protein